MESFRFLHASDFHLDRVPGGVIDLQDGLVEHLIQAAYKSVDSVFDCAIREHVDFVLLSGDIIDFSRASPRAIDFLTAQFQRLHEKKIPVYWLGGSAESGKSQPSDLRLPKSVYRFSSSRIQKVEVKKKKRTIAYIVGKSVGGHNYVNLDEMRVPRDGRFFVGMWYAKNLNELDADQLDDLGIDYWALGGCHEHRTLQTIIPAHFCGTPQGRSPQESGPHGCMLVRVTGDQIDDAQFVETDALRYRTERIDVQHNDDRQQLINKIKSRLQTIQHDVQTGKPMLVTWEIVDDGPLGRQLRDPVEYEPFLNQLGIETRLAGNQLAFTIGLRSYRSTLPSELYEEDSMLGDFLRTVRESENSGGPQLDLQKYLPNSATARRMANLLPEETQADRELLLREVATMAIDMLTGDPT